MKKQTKKILKITGISIGALVILVTAIIALVVNVVFTPSKLTPIVLNTANKNMNAKLDMNSVELTFLSLIHI